MRDRCRYDNTQLVTTYLAAYLLSEDRTDCAAPRIKLSHNQVSAVLSQGHDTVRAEQSLHLLSQSCCVLFPRPSG